MLNKKNISIGVLILFHCVGIGGVLFGDAEQFLRLTPLNLLLTLLIVLANQIDWSRWWVLAITYGVGFLIEVIGVNTGFPFGAYVYGPVLGPQLWNTPYLIGVNWLILLYGANAIAKKFSWAPWATALTAAGLMVLLDFLIEPVAIAFDFWSWTEGIPPIENYIGWFGTAALLSMLWQYSRLQLNTGVAFAVYAVELAFFGILNLFI